MTSSASITELVHEYASGDKGALNRLLPLVSAHLRRIVSHKLQHEPSGHSLQPTDLVHELYAKSVQISH